VSLIKTPGHTEEDITTLVEADEGVVAFTHLWWTMDGPSEDPYAPDPAVLHASRDRLLGIGVATIVPGHGPPFRPGEQTPR
jgi:glyoxylase-like metal-dependent hydrolase (beta-lactamase superfamily II)